MFERVGVFLRSGDALARADGNWIVRGRSPREPAVQLGEAYDGGRCGLCSGHVAWRGREAAGDFSGEEKGGANNLSEEIALAQA